MRYYGILLFFGVKIIVVSGYTSARDVFSTSSCHADSHLLHIVHGRILFGDIATTGREIEGKSSTTIRG